MRKTMVFAAFAALISLASCQKEEIIDNGTGKNDSPVFTASILETKTTVDVTDGKVAWEADDEITVTDAASASATYQVESIDATTGKATFVIKSGETALGAGPYTASYGTEPATAQTYSATAGKLYMTAPATSDNSFDFTVQCGLMKINLTKTGESVKSIAVTGTPAGGSETTYTLTCTEVQSIASAKDFFIALPAGSYKKIEITNASDDICTLNSASGVAVAANHIKPVTFGESKVKFAPALPVGALPGKFSVSATEQVQFSRGNLQATYDGSKYGWGFAANQYDYVGNKAGNTTINSQTSGAVVDIFGWSTSATNFGISTSEYDADYSGDFVDWGKNIGDGSTWRTLSKDEWLYLIKTRTNASSLYKTGVTVCGKANCLIIAPDGFTGTIAASYDATTWPAAEAAGLVCLPAAGCRRGSSVVNVRDVGGYWSSSAFGSDYAYSVSFDSSYVYPVTNGDRFYGDSVRLITESN